MLLIAFFTLTVTSSMAQDLYRVELIDSLCMSSESRRETSREVAGDWRFRQSLGNGAEWTGRLTVQINAQGMMLSHYESDHQPSSALDEIALRCESNDPATGHTYTLEELPYAGSDMGYMPYFVESPGWDRLTPRVDLRDLELNSIPYSTYSYGKTVRVDNRWIAPHTILNILQPVDRLERERQL